MSAEVVSLDDYRKEPKRVCQCTADFTCYSHRLVELVARVEDVHTDVEQFRFCDWATFDRLVRDVLGVANGIVADTLPTHPANERTQP